MAGGKVISVHSQSEWDAQHKSDKAIIVDFSVSGRLGASTLLVQSTVGGEQTRRTLLLHDQGDPTSLPL